MQGPFARACDLKVLLSYVKKYVDIFMSESLPEHIRMAKGSLKPVKSQLYIAAHQQKKRSFLIWPIFIT